MKPYRGTLFTAAVFLAALSLSGCGEAGDWKTTDGVTLEANNESVVVKEEVIFTVKAAIGTAAPAADVASPYQCETDIEYRAEGAGLDAYWHTVPGAGPTRVFVLEPRKVEPFAVVARGKCMDAKEDWKYSDQVDVTVTEPPEVPLPTATATLEGPTTYSRASGGGITFSLSGTGTSGCTLRLRFQASGTGVAVDVNPATPGAQAPVTPSSDGTLTAVGSGWCLENPTAVQTSTIQVIVSP